MKCLLPRPRPLRPPPRQSLLPRRPQRRLRRQRPQHLPHLRLLRPQIQQRPVRPNPHPRRSQTVPPLHKRQRPPKGRRKQPLRPRTTKMI